MMDLQKRAQQLHEERRKGLEQIAALDAQRATVAKQVAHIEGALKLLAEIEAAGPNVSEGGAE